MHCFWIASTSNLVNSWEKSERLLEESIDNLINSDNPLNYRKRTSKKKKNRGNATLCRFFQCIWFHSLSGDWRNGTSIWSPSKNCHPSNDALNEHESNGSLAWLRPDFLDIVAGILIRRFISALQFVICLDYVLSMFIDLRKENGFTFLKRQETDDIPQKQTYADYASRKYPSSNKIIMTYPRPSSRKHWPPCEHKYSGFHELYIWGATFAVCGKSLKLVN